jgi:hypothetical protein
MGSELVNEFNGLVVGGTGFYRNLRQVGDNLCASEIASSSDSTMSLSPNRAVIIGATTGCVVVGQRRRGGEVKREIASGSKSPLAQQRLAHQRHAEHAA